MPTRPYQAPKFLHCPAIVVRVFYDVEGQHAVIRRQIPRQRLRKVSLDQLPVGAIQSIKRSSGYVEADNPVSGRFKYS